MLHDFVFQHPAESLTLTRQKVASRMPPANANGNSPSAKTNAPVSWRTS
jgi:hypothetical protein